MPWRRMRGFTVGPVRPYGDVGAFEAIVEPHRYLHCLCGARLYQGRTFTGASVLICRVCQAVVDERRIA